MSHKEVVLNYCEISITRGSLAILSSFERLAKIEYMAGGELFLLLIT